jgi:hypothetical protein
MFKGWSPFHLGLLKPSYAVSFAAFWLAGLGSAFHLNGYSKSLENPAPLIIAGVVLLMTGCGTRSIATNHRAWERVIRDDVEKSDYLDGLRFASWTLWLFGAFALTKGTLGILAGA